MTSESKLDSLRTKSDLEAFFTSAREFTLAHHSKDLDHVNSRSWPPSFMDFMDEYIYVVCASGFRSLHAAKLAPKLYDALIKTNGEDEEALLIIFKNGRKIRAIRSVFNGFKDNIEAYQEFVNSINEIQDFKVLPYIGDITCYHIARNTGYSSVSKPDLHLTRLLERFEFENVQDLCGYLRENVDSEMSVGAIDFCLFVYMSHNFGEIIECCDSDIRIR
ncbi:hypothetical protein PCE1_000008 [Barthelona sp. PCE]